MEKNMERRYISKVTEGLRVKIPKDIAEIYGVKKDNMVEWIIDEKGSIKIEIKEMVLREKKAKVEKVGKDVGDAWLREKRAEVDKVMEDVKDASLRAKKVKVKKVKKTDVNDTLGG